MDEKLKLNIKLKSNTDLDNATQYFVAIQESMSLFSTKTNLNNKKYPYIEPSFFIRRLIAEKHLTSSWTKQRKIKLNGTKTIQVNFTLN